MPAGFDLWEAPDAKCKSCGYDGGHAHAKSIHGLQMENQELKNKLKFQEGMSSGERENIILLPVVAKSIATVIIIITLSIASCGIFSTPVLKPAEPVSTQYSEKTLEKMKEIYEQCIKDPVAMPADCIQAMSVVAGNRLMEPQ